MRAAEGILKLQGVKASRQEHCLYSRTDVQHTIVMNSRQQKGARKNLGIATREVSGLVHDKMWLQGHFVAVGDWNQQERIKHA
jgi:hypothetical protein